jgi:hypothetical protein
VTRWFRFNLSVADAFVINMADLRLPQDLVLRRGIPKRFPIEALRKLAVDIVESHHSRAWCSSSSWGYAGCIVSL